MEYLDNYLINKIILEIPEYIQQLNEEQIFKNIFKENYIIQSILTLGCNCDKAVESDNLPLLKFLRKRGYSTRKELMEYASQINIIRIMAGMSGLSYC